MRDPCRLECTVTEGARPTVVLLHGLSQQRFFWNPVVHRLTSTDQHPRIIAVDLRGHGDSPRPVEGAYDVPTCADDVAALLDNMGESRCVVVGHSWGAWVSTSLAARRPDLVSAVALVDGGFTRLSDLADSDEVRDRLTPPRLAMPLDELMQSIATGALAPWWSDEVREALLPTFVADENGGARTRLGFERHMDVLEGALIYDPVPDLASITVPAWLVRCSPLGSADPWGAAGDQALSRAESLLAQPRVQRWAGALHDVPLQWPWLIAGLIRACADEVASVEEAG